MICVISLLKSTSPCYQEKELQLIYSKFQIPNWPHEIARTNQYQNRDKPSKTRNLKNDIDVHIAPYLHDIDRNNKCYMTIGQNPPEQEDI